jgi:ketosteroid isomerase-like protein
MGNMLETQIIEAEERLREAMMHNDVQVLDDLISPDLLFTGISGQLASKAEDLAAHRARLLRLEAAELLERHIQLHSDFAVVSVLMHMVGTYQGTPIDQHIRYTRVWSISPNGSVQITAGHMSEVQSS